MSQQTRRRLSRVAESAKWCQGVQSQEPSDTACQFELTRTVMPVRFLASVETIGTWSAVG